MDIIEFNAEQDFFVKNSFNIENIKDEIQLKKFNDDYNFDFDDEDE